MRYRIQIEEMLGCTLCVVTEIVAYGAHANHTTKLYTLDAVFDHHGGLVELLGELQRVIGEVTP